MDEIIENENFFVSKWNSDTKFIIALISWTVGLNNIFHTPQLFFSGILYYIVIYIPLTIIIGIPMTFMELGVSQFSNTSATQSWNLCALFRGIGYSKVMMILMYQVYYNVLNSYVILYAMTSLSSTVKWSQCDKNWANTSCYNIEANTTEIQEVHRQSSVELFWYNRVLDLNGFPDKLEWPHWQLVGYLCATMFIVFLANGKRRKLLGKILSFAMIVSFLEIIVLLFVTTITPGSLPGYAYLFNPHFDVQNVAPWKNESLILKVFQDILYSMGLGLGGFSCLGAQSSFRKPIHAYAILCNFANVGFSIIYAIILFNFYALISHHRNVEINQILRPKSEFDISIFTVIPNGIFYLPGPTQLWTLIFYSSIFLQGLSSSVLMTSTILQVIYEFKPNFKNKSVICSFLCSLIVCVAGSILHTNVGIIISTVLNEIMYTTMLPFINSIQVLVILYIYGLVNFTDDMQFMLGFRPSAFWQLGLVMSSFLVPFFSVFSIMNFFEKHIRLNSNFNSVLERCVLSVILFWIPFMIMVRIIRKGAKKNLLQPSENWGPRDNVLKKSRKMFTSQNLTDEYIYEKTLLKNKLSRYEKNYNSHL